MIELPRFEVLQNDPEEVPRLHGSSVVEAVWREPLIDPIAEVRILQLFASKIVDANAGGADVHQRQTLLLSDGKRSSVQHILHVWVGVGDDTSASTNTGLKFIQLDSDMLGHSQGSFVQLRRCPARNAARPKRILHRDSLS